MHKMSRETDSPFSNAELRDAVLDSSLDRRFSVGHTGAAMLYMNRILIGCNDACSGDEDGVITDAAAHWQEYCQYPDEFFTHELRLPYLDKWYKFSGPVGARTLALNEAIYGEHLPGFASEVRLADVMEPQRKHACPAIFGGGVLLLADLYGKSLIDPDLEFIDYCRTTWRDFATSGSLMQRVQPSNFVSGAVH
jgi:hypothetical protein